MTEERLQVVPQRPLVALVAAPGASANLHSHALRCRGHRPPVGDRRNTNQKVAGSSPAERASKSPANARAYLLLMSSLCGIDHLFLREAPGETSKRWSIKPGLIADLLLAGPLSERVTCGVGRVRGRPLCSCLHQVRGISTIAASPSIQPRKIGSSG